MRRATVDKLAMLDSPTQQELIIQDIDELHNAPSERLFDSAVELFFAKWQSDTNAHMTAFLAYFRKEWIVHHKGWFVEYVVGPKTNNGLESTNAVIKKECTMRKRMSLPMFLAAASELIGGWSNERDPDHSLYRKPFAEITTIKHSDYVAAYQWVKDPSRFTILSSDKFYSRASASPINELSNADVKQYKTSVEKLSFKSFEQYHNIVNGIWVTTLNREEFRKSSCTCPSYLTNFLCKHIIGIAALQKIVKIPSQAKSVPMGLKPKRGRPTKTKKALQHQDPVVVAAAPPVVVAADPPVVVAVAPPVASKKRKAVDAEPVVAATASKKRKAPSVVSTGDKSMVSSRITRSRNRI